jgi:voltage-gated potassium channel
VGTSLIDSGIRKDLNLIVLSMKKADGQMRFNPSATTRLEAGDTVVAVGEAKSLLKLSRILNP